MGNRILIVGTYDTKDDELTYLADVIRKQGGEALTMDVSVLGDPAVPSDWSKHDVAAAAGSTIADAIASEDENPVSYTHLDVYKRQEQIQQLQCLKYGAHRNSNLPSQSETRSQTPRLHFS